MWCWPAACRRKKKASAARGRPRDPHSEGGRPAGQCPATAGSSATWRAAWARASIFPFNSTREIFEELREASRGGLADYYGITYEKIDQQMGVFWPCPTLDHPGTPRLFEDGRFFHPDGKRRFHRNRTGARAAIRSTRTIPIYLTTGRVVSQYLSGTQTRRIGALVDQYPEPSWRSTRVWRQQYGIADGDWVTVTSRRSAITLQAMVVRTIRPDTVFIPYHWPGERSANRLTHRTLDPRSKIPEFKVSACRMRKRQAAGLGRRVTGATP